MPDLHRERQQDGGLDPGEPLRSGKGRRCGHCTPRAVPPAGHRERRARVAKASRLLTPIPPRRYATSLFHYRAAGNLERAGVSQSVALQVSGHRTTSVYRHYRIVDEEDLREAFSRAEAFVERAVQQAERGSVIRVGSCAGETPNNQRTTPTPDDRPTPRKAVIVVVGSTELEPATSGLTDRSSNTRCVGYDRSDWVWRTLC